MTTNSIITIVLTSGLITSVIGVLFYRVQKLTIRLLDKEAESRYRLGKNDLLRDELRVLAREYKSTSNSRSYYQRTTKKLRKDLKAEKLMNRQRANYKPGRKGQRIIEI